MKTENLKHFAATKLYGKFEDVQSTFRNFEKTKETVRRKSVTDAGNSTDIPTGIICFRAGVILNEFYSASYARFTTNTIIILLKDGSQRNVEAY